MFDFYNIEIPKEIAGIMLCAILSDTVIYKSPTCTDKDIQACKELANIAKINDITALGMEMFIVKSAVDGATPRELTTRDFKDFVMGDAKIGVGQLEVVDLSTLDKIKKDLFADINKLKEEGNRHTVLLLLTDIMKEGSQILIASDDNTLIERAFDIEPEFNEAWLDGVMSRKKQIIPNLEKLFQ
jgi:manganese-dependent inorganic pyrophosphatase